MPKDVAVPHALSARRLRKPRRAGPGTRLCVPVAGMLLAAAVRRPSRGSIVMTAVESAPRSSPSRYDIDGFVTDVGDIR